MRVAGTWLIVVVACTPLGRREPPAPPTPPPERQTTNNEPEPEPEPASDPTPNDPPSKPDPTPPDPPHPQDPPPPITTYNRDAWPLWIDADGDCQDTRAEVLIAESEIPVTFTTDRNCAVATGRWRCPYTDRTFTDPKLLDIDHLVPLQHAHDSGGFAWDKKKRTNFANALDDADHLVAVYRSSNRSKGARSVEIWLPEEPGFRCQYVDAWRRIKKAWKLTESATEREAIDDALAKCRSKDVPERPSATTRDPSPKVLDVRDPPSGSCCKAARRARHAATAASRTKRPAASHAAAPADHR